MSIDLDSGFEEIGVGFGFSVLDQEEKPKEMFPNGILARHFVCLESPSMEKNERAWNVVSHKWANMQPANGRNRDVGGRVDAGIEASWGGKEGTKVNVFVEGELRDRDGNKVSGRINQDNQGNGNGKIRVGYDSDGK
jgi:hypothetical protein